jgi:hypothetical protein
MGQLVPLRSGVDVLNRGEFLFAVELMGGAVQVDPQLESAWFKVISYQVDFLVSSLCFSQIQLAPLYARG